MWESKTIPELKLIEPLPPHSPPWDKDHLSDRFFIKSRTTAVADEISVSLPGARMFTDGPINHDYCGSAAIAVDDYDNLLVERQIRKLLKHLPLCYAEPSALKYVKSAYEK